MANVKITALTNIGSNISYSALIPMVNMSGTPVTQQGNIQILGNYILSGAGSANFTPAALSNLAYSVVNAAQPNITSVGTLTSLAVTGNVTSSSYVTANFFVGDGGLLTNVSSAGTTISNGTSNVSIPAAGGNISISRGGVANVLVVTGTGVNVAGTLNSTGNLTSGNLTTTNINLTGNVTSNLRPSANVTYDLGSANQRWKDIWLANSTIHLGDATLSANGSSIVVESITITDGNVGNIGNIASVNLNGDVNDVLRGDGTWGAGGGSGNTGNVTFDNQAIIGTGDSFGGSGLYLAPGTDSIGNLQYLRVRGGDYATHIHFDTGNSEYYDQYFGDDGKFVKLEAGSTGNIVVGAQGMSQNYIWTFDSTGNLNLPGNTFAFNYANGDPVTLGGNTIGNFVVTGNMFMLNDPNIDMVIQQSATDMTSIRLIPDGQPEPGVHIETGSGMVMYHWIFDDSGNLISPGNVILEGTQIFAGPGASELPNIANATLVISSNSEAYIQALINNVSDIGSADWVAQGAKGDDDGGYADFGFNSAAHEDPEYSLTGPGDGYILVQGYYPGQGPAIGGGNLILATGVEGLNRDIIFGMGGYTSANMFAKMSDANTALELSRPGTILRFGDNSTLGEILGAGANTFGITATANSNVLIKTSHFDGSFSTEYVWQFGENGTFTPPELTVDLHNGGIQLGQVLQFGDPGYQAIITGPTPEANVNAQRLIIQGQRGNGELSEGGDVYLWGGDANTNGGDIKIYAGDADDIGIGFGGYVNIDGGSGDIGGVVTITGGQSTGSIGADVRFEAGVGATTGGQANITGGFGTVTGGGVSVRGGQGGAGPGGNVTIVGGVSANGLVEYGNVLVQAGASTWTFDNSGNLAIPKSITGNVNSQFDIASNANEAYLTTTTDDSTALYMTATEVQLYANSNAYVNSITAAVNIGANSDVTITSNTGNVNQLWTFGNDGRLTFPGTPRIDTATNNFEIQAAESINLEANVVVNIYTDTGNSAYQWQFGDDGVLTIPGNLVAVSASPAPILSGFSSVSAEVFTSSVVAYANLPVATIAGRRAFISDANLVAAGNFGTIVSGGGANNVPVYSDGSDWRIG